ncbi:triose-phosphate isomerase, partial [Pseudomonas sp. NPDC087346]
MRRPMVAGNWKMHGTRVRVDELILGIVFLL